MAQSPRKDAWNEQLWNVSLLPMRSPRRAAQQPQGPAPHDGGSALRSAALLSVSESEFGNQTAQAA